MARLGRTELDVFPLGLGGIPLMRLSPPEAREVVAAALDGGINFADTAEGYGDSEEKLAHALRSKREEFVIISKSMERSGAGMLRAVEQSLRRLQTGHIDIYQLHSIKTGKHLEQVFAPGGAMDALQTAKAEGKIRFIGITGHRPAILVEALKTGHFDTVQVPINVVDREAEDKLLPLAKEMDIGIIAMKPVCGGTLDDAALGLRFCLNTLADSVLCGMKSVAEVRANLEAVRSFRPLAADEEETLLFQASQLGEQFCRRCDYCQPCPSQVPIPKILWLSNYNRRYAERDPWTEDEYRALSVNSTGCDDCGRCEAKCPYDLPVRQMLKEAHQRLAPSGKTVAKRKLKQAAKKIIGKKPELRQ